MSYFSYIDLPKIPSELIESVDAILNKPPKHNIQIPTRYRKADPYPFIQIRNVEQNLKDYINYIFNRKCLVQYQIIREGCYIHKDPQRRVAFNYILNTGGEYASTNVYTEDRQLIQSVCVERERWIALKTDVFHNVTNLTTERVGVSVEIPDYVWGDKL
jgi:hypothetical protein